MEKVELLFGGQLTK